MSTRVRLRDAIIKVHREFLTARDFNDPWLVATIPPVLNLLQEAYATVTGQPGTVLDSSVRHALSIADSVLEADDG